MKYTQKSFSVGVGERSPEVCANVGHSTEPDQKGKCLFCGAKIGIAVVAVVVGANPLAVLQNGEVLTASDGVEWTTKVAPPDESP